MDPVPATRHSDEVIHEVDVALRSLIEREATAGTEVEVVFDAPTKDWAGRRNVPTIDVYLYDIREDLRRRERGLINEYDQRDRVRARHLPPRHFKLSYLVTAWTQRPEDEHRLLSALLSCFLRHDAMPAEFLTGPLADLGLPVAITVALPPPEDRSFADVWSALGGELKPSLDVVISAPTDTGQQYVAGPPVERPPTISLGGSGGQGWPPREDRQRLVAVSGGTVTDGSGPGDTGPGTADGTTADGTGAGSAGSTGSPRSGSARSGRADADRPVATAGGMSWRDLAGSGRRAATGPTGDTERAGGTGSAADAEPGPASAGEAERKPKPRRRRSSGIDQK